jgi:hypothetical protein
MYEYYTSTCIILNNLKYIPFSYVEIIRMISPIRHTLHIVEFEPFRQMKHDSYCIKIQSSSNNTFQQYEISHVLNYKVWLSNSTII